MDLSMKPKFCPNCGKPFKSVYTCIGNEWQDKSGRMYYSHSYDCYCDSCDWGGDISPDSELDIEGIPEPTPISIEEDNGSFMPSDSGNV